MLHIYTTPDILKDSKHIRNNDAWFNSKVYGKIDIDDKMREIIQKIDGSIVTDNGLRA